MAKAKKLPSGNWRVLVFSGYDKDGKRKYESFTDPNKKEAEFLAAEFKAHKKAISQDRASMTLSEAIDAYVSSRDGVLSPTTVAGYYRIKKYYFQNLLNRKLKTITTHDLIESVNNESKRRRLSSRPSERRTLSPKTIRNAYMLLVSVFREYFPELNTDVPLPSQVNTIKEVLSPEVIINAVRGTDIELPVLLAMWLSFSMSEILGLTHSKSINDDFITIRETLVTVNGQKVRKEHAKEYYRNRRLRIPGYIKTLIDQTDQNNDALVSFAASTLRKKWARLLEEHDLPHMAFHDLRHVNASVMAELGIPDKYAQERGGWKTDQTMKRVYQHTFSRARQEVDNLMDDYFLRIMQHDMQHK